MEKETFSIEIFKPQMQPLIVKTLNEKNNNYKNLNLEILIVCEGMKCGLKLGKSRQKGFRDVLSSKLSKPTDRIWSLYNCEIIFFGIDGRG